MKIAIVDVAAESGGALSVLKDFLNYISSLDADTNEYFVFVSMKIDIVKSNIHYIVDPGIKKSWFSRLKWERFAAVKEFKKLGIDVIISLQNTAFFSKSIRQLVYFHNVLLLEKPNKYSLRNKAERKYAVYTRAIAPYTMRSLKYANMIVCQTNTVKNEINSFLPGAQIKAVYPNVNVDERFLDTFEGSVRGFVYPTASLPFKKIETVVKSVEKHKEWFVENKIEFLITIDGNENEYAAQIKRLSEGLQPIKLIGYQKREDIFRLYRDHALLVNSELESYPIPFREAQLIGAPIVAADYPYAQEILGNDPQAFLFRKNDIDDMFSKMKTALHACRRQGNQCNNVNSWETILEILCELN